MENTNKKKRTKNDHSGSLMLLLTALIWGLAFVAQSAGMKYIGAFTFNSARTVIAAFVLIPIIFFFRRADKNERSRSISLKYTVIGGIICGIVLFAASSFQQSGIALTTAGKAGFITALYIVIVPVLEFIIYRKTSAMIWVCILIAVCGSYLLCIKEDLSIGRGDLLVLICALFYALHIMVIDFFSAKNTDGMIMSFIQFVTAGIIMLICTFAFEDPNIKSLLSAWKPILYAGVLSSGAGYTLQILGQRRTSPAVATLIMSLESVFAVLSGWLILGEKLSPKEIFG
ncbi:MAG: DMT family transporter, partial [Firmicutes bacterium]|nr:DMT family transporter [Bacillota bacterium]